MVVRAERALGAVIGSAVGDALGAPFEFGPEGAFSDRFPEPGHGSEMCGGGGWDPGEATDDTQMAVLVAESLVECGGLELPDIFRRFQPWAAAEPKDIGLQTEAVLSSGAPWGMAAALHFQVNQRAAGNGALMRAAPSAVHFAPHGREATMDAARRLAALTHGDRAAWEGTAVFHELIRVALDTVAAVTGGLAGAVYGLAAVPERWTAPLHVPLPGFADRVLRTSDLANLTHRLTS
ncbi:ADP-ribosylglycohydrolase family protein [Streptomyces canus]|uniref:ADP-ribosylglycohydrolase family protein n=1 Tax=Streptomyces canus TaxID=58343 RepID=UPI00381BCA49